MELTPEQREVMLKLGSTQDLDDPRVSQKVIDELLQMGLLYKRAPRHIDFTDEGERVYNELAGEHSG